ncbi:hypothetical protein BN2476_350065 [Paraburkholderia piptadeniae]|uniref:Uncharacterized protein n=1 Tax=Paraburkholderia piptadeniae TaxID=1701573 RepID=A0A1N7S7J9_9BURK|nr:hypothetical protein BN2476_350065 [Paraburkholderia piptadeniae]
MSSLPRRLAAVAHASGCDGTPLVGTDALNARGIDSAAPVAAAIERNSRRFIHASREVSRVLRQGRSRRARVRTDAQHAQGKNLSALVQFAYGVFDVLPQQTPFFRRHMPVAPALIEIGRHGGGADDGVGCGMVGVGIARLTHGAHVRTLDWARLGYTFCRRFGMRGDGTRSAHEHDRNCHCDHAQAHVRPDPSLHLVPFVARQPATSDTCNDSGLKPGARALFE